MQAQGLSASLEAPPPMVSPEEVRVLLLDQYGMTGEIGRLGSERDANFLLEGPQGAAVVKIANDAEPVEVTGLQTAMLLHLESSMPDLPVPRLLRNRDGAPECHVTLDCGTRHILRLLSRLPGAPSFMRFDKTALARLAAQVADLDRGLSDFASPHGHHDLLWDVSHADRVRDLLPMLDDQDDRALVSRALDRWSSHVAPRLGNLRAQVIHNDLNRHNLLFDARNELTGIIDFGDAIHAPLIAELAIVIAYFADADRLVDDAVTMAAAYHARLSLVTDELELLFDLVAARHALTLAITGWRARRHPANSTYILRNAPAARQGLAVLLDLPARARERLLSACPGERR